MRKALNRLVIYSPLMLLASCDVHEWPDSVESVQLVLKLDYSADMTVWNHTYDGSEVTEQGLGETYDNRRENGEIRYVIRAYPASGKQRSDPAYEFVVTKDIAEGYDHEEAIGLPPGDYEIMVWSDIVEYGGKTPYYDAGDFSEIKLQGDHEGNNDYRDAFRGTGSVSLAGGVTERPPVTLDIAMERPLAKFEFITGDVEDFIEKEALRRSAADGGGEAAADGSPETRFDADDYMVVFYYVGFMPDTYSMYTDKPVDSSTGVMFRSTLKSLSASEASMGFDYVLVNGKESAVTVQVGLYDIDDGTQLSLTDPITVPLKRSRHTVVRGRFLSYQASGGVTISPGYDGDHNVILP